MSQKTLILLAPLFLLAHLSAFETPQQALDASSKAMRSKNFTEAHKCLNEAFKLAVNPTERFIALSRHAELFKAQNNWESAEEKIRLILNDSKMSPQQKASAWLNMARFKEAQKKYEDAVEAYQNSLELHKEGSQAQEALNKCGLLLIRLKDYAAAIECFRQVSAVPNKDLRRSTGMKQSAWANIAAACIAMKQYGNAAKTLEEAAKQPEFKDARAQADLWKKVLKIYESQIREAVRFKKFDSAEAALQELKKRDSSNALAALEAMILKGKASVAARKRDYKAAESFYQTAMKLKGLDTKELLSVYSDLLNLHLRVNKLADAEKTVKQIMTLPCRNAEEQFLVSDCRKRYLCSVKKYDEAVKLLEETANLKGLRPARIARCYELICQICLNNKKDLKTAKKYYQKAAAVPGARWKSPYLKKKLGI